MKAVLKTISLLLVTAHLNAAEVVSQKNAVLLLSPDTETTEGCVAVEKLKSDLAAQGVIVTEIPADEAQDIWQAGLIAAGGPVITTESGAGKIDFKVHDGISGADITKTSNAKPAGVSPGAKVEHEKEPMPVAAAISESEMRSAVEKSVAHPGSHNKSSFVWNHIGLSIGPSSFTKKEDSLEMLQRFNSGSRLAYTKISSRLQLFYERRLSKKYTLGLSAELMKGGGTTYENNGRTLSVDADNQAANVYIMRNLGRYFGLYLGGGTGRISLRIADPSDMAGTGAAHTPFKSDLAAAHAEAGIGIFAGNFSLRFSLRNIFSAQASDITTVINGSRYRLTVKNGKTLGYKAVGQKLANNERLYLADFGGTAAAVSLSYSFVNW